MCQPGAGDLRTQLDVRVRHRGDHVRRNGAITLGSFPGAPSGIIAISGGIVTPTIFMGSANPFTITGTFYAPAGQIMDTGGGVSVNTFTGSMVGSEIFFGLSAGSTWNFSSGGASGGSGWSLYQ